MLGQRVRERRESLEMTQKQLRKAVGYENDLQIKRVEQGVVPRGVMLVRIAKALSTTAEYLVTGEGPASTHAAPATHTLSPRDDDPPALTKLAGLLKRLHAPLTPAELAWLRQMPAGSESDQYQAAIEAYRDGAAKTQGARGAKSLAAPPAVSMPASSSTREIEPKSVRPAAKKRAR